MQSLIKDLQAWCWDLFREMKRLADRLNPRSVLQPSRTTASRMELPPWSKCSYLRCPSQNHSTAKPLPSDQSHSLETHSPHAPYIASPLLFHLLPRVIHAITRITPSEIATTGTAMAISMPDNGPTALEPPPPPSPRPPEPPEDSPDPLLIRRAGGSIPHTMVYNPWDRRRRPLVMLRQWETWSWAAQTLCEICCPCYQRLLEEVNSVQIMLLAALVCTWRRGIIL